MLREVFCNTDSDFEDAKLGRKSPLLLLIVKLCFVGVFSRSSERKTQERRKTMKNAWANGKHETVLFYLFIVFHSRLASFAI